MKKVNKNKIAKKVLKDEANALVTLSKKLGKKFEDFCDVILKCKGKIITIGLGKSGHIAAKFSATLSSTGTPSAFLHASEALHGDMGMIDKNDVVIFFSNSGETKELLLVIPLLKYLKLKILSVTGSDSSSLAKISHIHLNAGVKKEACPLNLTPTSSVITAMGLSDAIAITLLESRGFTSKDFAKSHPQGYLGKRLLKNVKNVMFTNKLPTISQNTLLLKAIDKISKCKFGVAIIINQNKSIVGIFTDGDLRRTLKANPNVTNIIVKDVMTKKPKCIEQDILAAEALTIMEESKISSLIVVDKNKKLIGLLTLNELIRSGI
ncbi:MAG: D-arabinose 5-phosphate isomerase [Gammaproteobacteria bacterium]|nr:D-arabinose 5-phosphate isomerase [Gammaproteobacteria bacterium]|tara:strand:- start:370 stop:1335 length:966 start_codon:yes stop_codon:yes gene_type:complete